MIEAANSEALFDIGGEVEADAGNGAAAGGRDAFGGSEVLPATTFFHEAEGGAVFATLTMVAAGFETGAFGTPFDAPFCDGATKLAAAAAATVCGAFAGAAGFAAAAWEPGAAILAADTLGRAFNCGGGSGMPAPRAPMRAKGGPSPTERALVCERGRGHT